MNKFQWWRVSQYGMAESFPDTPDIRKRVDSGEPGWYDNVEGTIIHGGVQATAYKVYHEDLFDSAAWLSNGMKILVGQQIRIEITAEPK